MLIALLALIAYFIILKFFKSDTTDNQELDEELFLEKYIYGKK